MIPTCLTFRGRMRVSSTLRANAGLGIQGYQAASLHAFRAHQRCAEEIGAAGDRRAVAGGAGGRGESAGPELADGGALGGDGRSGDRGDRRRAGGADGDGATAGQAGGRRDTGP